MSNIVYIAASLDGYIADKNNKVDWLHDIPNPSEEDLGFHDVMERIDALVMGRNTLETVLSFGGDWPYNKPVFVLSHTMTTVPKGYEDRIFLMNGGLYNLTQTLKTKGFHHLYIDGGITIQHFLKEDMIDELIITTIPVLLGEGVPLFGQLSNKLKFKHTQSKRHLDYLVTNYFVRDKSSFSSVTGSSSV